MIMVPSVRITRVVELSGSSSTLGSIRETEVWSGMNQPRVEERERRARCSTLSMRSAVKLEQKAVKPRGKM